MTSGAILLTVANRVGYLKRTLESWSDVRGFQDWPLYVFVEPSESRKEIRGLLYDLDHPNLTVIENKTVLGVLENPYQGFEYLFRKLEFDFVIRAEDDLCVSTDILEYFDWASRKYEFDPEIASVHAYTDEDGEDDSAVYRRRDFNPLVWGTWWEEWTTLMGPTWDRDYSTYNGVPGHQAGWDWNLNTRILPAKGLKGIFPAESRVENIGVFGTHSTPDYFRTSPSYIHRRGKQNYHEVPDLAAV